MSYFSAGKQWHFRSLDSTAAEVVRYYRGERAILVQAVRGDTVFDQLETNGEIRAQTKAFDWLIKPSTLVFDGLSEEPQKGDQIETSEGELFDVMTSQGNAVWEWSDSGKTFYRIHSTRRNV